MRERGLYLLFYEAALKDTLNSHSITYVFLRDQEGLERLKTAYEKKLPVAIMCSERKPCDCYRTKLIGPALSSMNICLDHIDEKGRPYYRK